MDDKPLDMSKNAYSPTPETQLLSSKILQVSAKECKQLPTSKSVEMCGKEFSKPDQNREVRAEKEFIKADLTFQSCKDKASESRDTTPESHVSIRRNLNVGPSKNSGVKRHVFIQFASDKKIKDKQRTFADPNFIETVDYSSPRPLDKNTSRFYARTLHSSCFTSSISMFPIEEQKTLDLACNKSASRKYINVSPSTSNGVNENHDWIPYQEFSRNPNQVSPLASITPSISMSQVKQISTLFLACDKSTSRDYMNASPSTSSGVSGNYDWRPYQEIYMNPNQVSPCDSFTSTIGMSLVEQISNMDLDCNNSASRDNMNVVTSTSSGVSGNHDCAPYQNFSRNLNQVLPYECAQCAERFSEVIRFIRHVMTHGKPYICSVCKKKFSRLGTFKNHPHVPNKKGGMLFTSKILQNSFSKKEIIGQRVI